jgi:hypothetical protein
MPLPCGCHGECACPPYLLAGATFFAGVAVVLTSPVLFALPERRPNVAVVSEAVLFGLGVFLVLALLQFAFTILAIVSALLDDWNLASVRIWTAARVVVAMALGAGGGVGTVLLLWVLVSFA